MAGGHEQLQELTTNLNGLFSQFKEVNERAEAERKRLGTETGEVKAQADKLQSGMDNILEQMKSVQTQWEKSQEEAKGYKERLDELETRFNRPAGTHGAIIADVEAAKALRNNFLRFAVKSIGRSSGNLDSVRVTEAEQKAYETYKEAFAAKALNIGTDTAGGYLVPEDYRAEILKTITEYSPVRTVARVIQTGRDSVKFPKRTGQFSAAWVAEQGTRSETTGLTFGLESIPVHELYALVDISEQMLEDAAFDMEEFIRMEAAEQFAVAEGTAFVSGNGVGKPEGLTATNAGLSSVNSGAATALTADGLIGLFYALKDSYARNGTWMCKRATHRVIREMKDGDGQYLWQPGLQAGQPPTLLGQPIVEAVDFTGPTSGTTYSASAKPIAFGDFRRGYLVVDRVQMSMLRDPYTQATSGNVRMIFRKRVGGQVIQSEAIQLQNVAA